jgi:hypothetical protein
MQQHLGDKHLAEKCNFCNEKLYAHWPAEWRYQHMVRKHMDVFKSFVSQEGDEAVRIPDKKLTDRAREGHWRFCSRCGRDYGVLDVRADRQHHDNVCYPGVQDRESDWVACGTCGDHTTDARTHQHSEAAEGEKPFCEHCALPLGLFSEGYAAKHLSFCKGHGRDNAQHCPWCGVQLDDDFDARMAHIEGCGRKPSADAEGPIDTARRAYFLTGPSRGASTSTRATPRPVKRRRTEKAAEPASEAQKRPAKKSVPLYLS